MNYKPAFKNLFILFLLFFSPAFSGLMPAEEKGAHLLSENKITYRTIFQNPLVIHILEINPRNFQITIGKALEDGLGRETLSSISERYEALAAINGGFFSIGDNFDGLPQGILKIGPKWFASSQKGRGAIGWKANGSLVLFDRIDLEPLLTIDGNEFPIDGLNQQRSDTSAILYSWAFHRTTLTKPGGTEIIIRDNKITEIRESKGNSEIPENGYVFSIGKESKIDPKTLKIGSLALIQQRVHLSKPDKKQEELWRECDFIVGGTPLLLFEGNIPNDFKNEKVIDSFLYYRHARTAIGVKENGNWVMVVVDGEQNNQSKGMTIQELALFMKSLNCVYALNLDGGGSSTMYLEGSIINSPTGDLEASLIQRKERRISDAILVLPKEK